MIQTTKFLKMSFPRMSLKNTKFSLTYLQTSNIKRTIVFNEIIDHSDVVGASPVGAAPTTSSFST